MRNVMPDRPARAHVARASPLMDRLFEGGCTMLFIALIATVTHAVWPYL
jgi:hypothetical protein